MNEEQKVVSFTIEDCYHVCRLLYPDRSEKKKLKLAQRLHWNGKGDLLLNIKSTRIH